ncbi:hypothetical protein DPMN_018991 [Dreissena polymorpha]|uniref:Cadherin domain-containing protein n=1 Tax=Dreissena polymorpha TaxID=45954 RepID=A0A9D4NE77_DREPO|nr:hypothetical protein DPMN_018991 [Dreissena polymorpha]
MRYVCRIPASLNYDVTPVHNVTINCDDGNVFSARNYYVVELENSPSVFVNLPAVILPIGPRRSTIKLERYCTCRGHSTFGAKYCDTAEYPVPAVNVEITCGDSLSTVKKTLIVNIINTAPVITYPGGSSDVAEDVSGTLTLKTLDFVTFDKSDATCSMTSADRGPFAVTGNQIVKMAGALDSETKATYNLDVTCTDGLLQTTDTYVVKVQNVGPEITSLPTASTVDEWQTAEKQLTTLTLTEDAADCVQTYLNIWVIYSVSEAVAGRSLSYDTNPSYNLHIQCSDAAGVKGAEKIFTVHINDNKAPTIDNLSMLSSNDLPVVIGSPITKLSLVAKDSSATDTVFTATGSDVENDNVIYSMLSLTPNATCPFIMSPNRLFSRHFTRSEYFTRS